MARKRSLVQVRSSEGYGVAVTEVIVGFGPLRPFKSLTEFVENSEEYLGRDLPDDDSEFYEGLDPDEVRARVVAAQAEIVARQRALRR